VSKTKELETDLDRLRRREESLRSERGEVVRSHAEAKAGLDRAVIADDAKRAKEAQTLVQTARDREAVLASALTAIDEEIRRTEADLHASRAADLVEQAHATSTEALQMAEDIDAEYAPDLQSSVLSVREALAKVGGLAAQLTNLGHTVNVSAAGAQDSLALWWLTLGRELGINVPPPVVARPHLASIVREAAGYLPPPAIR
jgi:hypothetical protein